MNLQAEYRTYQQSVTRGYRIDRLEPPQLTIHVGRAGAPAIVHGAHTGLRAQQGVIQAHPPAVPRDHEAHNSHHQTQGAHQRNEQERRHVHGDAGIIMNSQYRFQARAIASTPVR